MHWWWRATKLNQSMYILSISYDPLSYIATDLIDIIASLLTRNNTNIFWTDDPFIRRELQNQVAEFNVNVVRVMKVSKMNDFFVTSAYSLSLTHSLTLSSTVCVVFSFSHFPSLSEGEHTRSFSNWFEYWYASVCVSRNEKATQIEKDWERERDIFY